MTEPAIQNESRHCAVAGYVAAMSVDLAGMARRAGLETLGYLLDMVRLEAENVVRHEQSNRQR